MLLRSIRTRLLGLVLATVVPFTALVGVGLWKQWQHDSATAVERATAEARLIAAQIDDHIGNLRSLLTGLGAAVSLDAADTAANDALLQRAKSDLPGFVANIMVFDLRGNNIGTSLQAGRFNAADRDYFQRVIGGQRLTISVPRIARITNRWVVTIARPIHRDGRLRGVIAVGTELHQFQEALRIKDLPSESIVQVVDENGIVVARSSDSAKWVGRDIGRSPSVTSQRSRKEGGDLLPWPDGPERITGFVTANLAPWQVSVGLPQEIAYAEVIKRLHASVLFLTVTFGFALAIAWMLSGRIVRPLRQLGKDAAALAAGQLDHRSDVHGIDEVGALAENFNQMAEALERRHEEAARAADEMRTANDTLAAVIDASPVAIACSDPARRFILWSRGAEQIFGHSAEDVLGKRNLIVPPGQEAGSKLLFDRAIGGEAVRDVQAIRMRKDGSLIDVRIAAAPMYNPDGKVRAVAWVYEDITDSKKAEAQLNRLAHFDQLTGLANRLSLQNELTRLLSSRDGPQPASVALFDLDGFKDVNDTLGHSTGDKLLIEVGHRLTAVAEQHVEVGLVGRLGGDEFVAIFPQCGDPRAVAGIIEEMLLRLSEPYNMADHVLHIDASAGVAIAPGDGTSVDELIANADLALYQAKAEGGRICRFFLPVLRAQAQARRGLDLELRRAVNAREFELYYQPQIKLGSETVVGVEALLRWRHPTRGILAPGAFIEALAESPISGEVGRWIIRTACASLAEWRAKDLPLARVAVNLFPGQARDEDLAEEVLAALEQCGLPAHTLELELTEYAAFDHGNPTGPLLKLHEAGVRLAFDDFGTGYASLNYLSRFPVSRIKIDRSFVAKITDDAEDAAIVRSLIAMAHNLELEVIAEGVETEAQAELLCQEGCQEAQGYLYAMPLPAAELESFLRNHSLALQVDEKASARPRRMQRRSGRAPGRRALRR
ncbi:MAG: EAL domain-containing protein [Hyphomicrobiales bacterium]|nr:EAL domain-containing protein [Hyphomicrobiales bacterium]